MSFPEPNGESQSFELDIDNDIDNDAAVIARIALLCARQPLRVDALTFDGATSRRPARLRLRVAGDARTLTLLQRQLRAVVDVRAVRTAADAVAEPSSALRRRGAVGTLRE